MYDLVTAAQTGVKGVDPDGHPVRIYIDTISLLWDTPQAGEEEKFKVKEQALHLRSDQAPEECSCCTMALSEPIKGVELIRRCTGSVINVLQGVTVPRLLQEP